MKIFASLFASALLLSACGQSTPTSYSDGKVVGCNSINHQAATGMDLFCLGDNSVITLEGLRGPMILNVWGSWCEPCKAEIPFIRKFYDKYKEKVQVVGLDVEEPNKEAAQPFIKSHGVIWPSLFDPDGRSRAVIGMGVPVTWFIDSNGKVIDKKVGAFKDAKEIETLTKKNFNLR